MIEIDGSAGGQTLRTACALSAVTKKPCRVFNIRKSRPKPGLMPQHLLGIQALAQLCAGRLEGDFLGSEEIKFYPGEIRAKDLHVKIETAGSITLYLQSLLPAVIFAPNPVKISFKGGGTDVPFSPTMDYFCFTFSKILEKMGPKVEVNILKRGYYPEGGGEVEAKIYPSKLKPINLTDRGNLQKILIISRASEFLKEKMVAERQIAGCLEILRKLNLPIEKTAEYSQSQSQSPGSSICLAAIFENTIIGIDNLGKLGISAEEIGKKAAQMLLEEEKTQACLDEHMSDQILVYMALSRKLGKITASKVTSHCLTNIWTIEKFIPGKFEIKNNLIAWVPAGKYEELLTS